MFRQLPIPKIGKLKLNQKLVLYTALLLLVGSAIINFSIICHFVTIFYSTGNRILTKSWSLFFYSTFNDWERYAYIVLEWTFSIGTTLFICLRIIFGFGISACGVFSVVQKAGYQITIICSLLFILFCSTVFFIEQVPHFINIGANVRMLESFFERYVSENYNHYVPPKEAVAVNAFAPSITFILGSLTFCCFPCIMLALCLMVFSCLEWKNVEIPGVEEVEISELTRRVKGTVVDSMDVEKSRRKKKKKKKRRGRRAKYEFKVEGEDSDSESTASSSATNLSSSSGSGDSDSSGSEYSETDSSGDESD